MYMAVGAALPRQGCFYNRCPGLVCKHKRLLFAQITFKFRSNSANKRLKVLILLMLMPLLLSFDSAPAPVVLT